MICLCNFLILTQLTHNGCTTIKMKVKDRWAGGGAPRGGKIDKKINSSDHILARYSGQGFLILWIHCDLAIVQ